MKWMTLALIVGAIAACSTRTERAHDAYVEADANCRQSGYQSGDPAYDYCMQYLFNEYQAEREHRRRLAAAFTAAGSSLTQAQVNSNAQSRQSGFNGVINSNCSQQGVFLQCSGHDANGVAMNTTCSRNGSFINCQSR
jgi:hypothetical protein